MGTARLLNECIETKITKVLAVFSDHGATHEANPSHTFACDALTWPKQFALVVLHVRLVFFFHGQR